MKLSSLLAGAAVASLMLAAACGASAQSWADSTTVSGRMYFDFSNITNKVDGVKTGAANGTGFDIKRFYIGVDHKFTDLISVNVTTDFQTQTFGDNAVAGAGSKATELYLKKAYVDLNFSPMFDVKAGSTDLPWVPYAEGLYGNRYIENTIADKQKVATSADWGLHAAGVFGLPSDTFTFSYAVSAINGNGYKNPTRSKSMDLEGRLSMVYAGQWNFAIGGYTGKLGQNVVGANTPHKASRFDALAAWVGDHGRAGVEYYSTSDYNAKYITGASAEDKATGYSVFGTYRLSHSYSLFGRMDDVKPSKTITPTKKDKYYNAGVTYSVFKNVDFSLVAKHSELTSPLAATAKKTVNDELGVFAQVRY